MKNVPQELIDEAAKRGIVPGAIIRCAAEGDEASVLPYSQWKNKGWGENYIFMDPPPCLGPWIYHNGEWATVITPAPAKEGEGLVDGDACECGIKMREGIRELANELGLNTYPECGTRRLAWTNNKVQGWCGAPNVITTEAFIAKMRVTAKLPKPEPPIVIDGHEVKYEKGRIKVGCQYIPNATVRAIAEKLID